jgi:thioredoxin-dependent peroxiredoxin
MSRLNSGDRAPDFTLEDQTGTKVSLADFAGQKLLIYFYPKADTPGCTTQACSIRDSKSGLKKRGISFLGISPDLPATQQKFDDKYELGFPLLADPEHKIADAYGVWGEKSAYGKKSVGIHRSSFLIDETGRLMRVWYDVKPEDTVPNVINALQD